MGKIVESKYLTTTNVYKYLGISKSLLYKIMNADPTFPKGLNITGSKKVFDKEDIDKWLRSKSEQK